MRNFFLRIYVSLRRWYWWLRRPTTVGVRAIVTDADNRVLLVKHTYTNGWYFPGGGLKRNESAADALLRELEEEVGIIPRDYTLFGIYHSNREYKKDEIHVFHVTEWAQQESSDAIEIDDCRFWEVHELPKGVSPGTHRRILEWSQNLNRDMEW